MDSLTFSPVLAEVLKLSVKLFDLAKLFKLSTLLTSLGGNKSALFSIKIEGKHFLSLNNSISSTDCFHFKALYI